MPRLVVVLTGALLVIPAAFGAASNGPPAAAEAGEFVRSQLQPFDRPLRPEGPPLTLNAVLDEALERNPVLVALRREYEAAQHRPVQELFLRPPSFETQIWQWPINSLNPANTNMYMFMFGQDIPGRGKRRLRAAVAEKGVELAENAIAVEAREVIDQVKRVYAGLFISRKAVAFIWPAWICYGNSLTSPK